MSMSIPVLVLVLLLANAGLLAVIVFGPDSNQCFLVHFSQVVNQSAEESSMLWFSVLVRDQHHLVNDVVNFRELAA